MPRRRDRDVRRLEVSVRMGLRLAGIVAGITWSLGCDVLTVKPTFEVTLVVPDELTVGQPFALVVDVKNPHGSAIKLDSVDVADTLLKGFQVVSVEPSAKDTMHVPLLDQRSWSFETSVAAGATHRVTFNLKPLLAGRFSGNVDACNPGQDCASTFADLVVGLRKPAPPVAHRPPGDAIAR
jgi:hypothetical protein